MKVRWVAELSRNDILVSNQNDAIPLVDPGCSLRRSRWHQVIRWYGQRLGLTHLRPRLLERARCPVIAIGNDVWKAADYFAAIEGRPAVLCRDCADAARHIRVAKGADRPIVFASHLELTNTNLRAMRSDGKLQCSLVTGYDAAAVHFMAIKVAMWGRRAPNRHANGVVLIDELAGHVSFYDAAGEEKYSDFESSNIGALLEADHDCLLLHVHGEGSHANLRDIVICGVTFETEKVDGLAVSGGCRSGTESEARSCKRVHSKSIQARGFEEVKAAEVALLSCNGLSVSGELYPSGTSCLLSMIDGYAAAVVCNDRNVPLSSTTVDLVHLIVARGGSILDAVELLNSAAMLPTKEDPWFVFGLPWLARLKWESPTADGHFSAEEGLTILRIPSCFPVEEAIRVVDFGGTVKSVMRGRDRIAFTYLADTTNGGVSGRIVGAGKDVLAAEHWLALALASCVKAKFLELGLDIVFGRAARDKPELASDFAELHELRVVAERSLALLGSAINRVRETGWAGKSFDLCLTHSQTAVSEWDRALSALAAGNLIAGSFEACLREGHRYSSAVTVDGCLRCGGPLLSEEMSPVSGFGAFRTWTTCTTCGPRSCMETRRLAIDVTAPRQISPGQRVEVEVRVSDAEPLFGSQPRFLAMHLRDKGCGRTIHVSNQALFGDVHVVSFDVPDDVTPDLHTLRVTVVHGMRIAYMRLRVACVPPRNVSRQIAQVARL